MIEMPNNLIKLLEDREVENKTVFSWALAKFKGESIGDSFFDSRSFDFWHGVLMANYSFMDALIRRHSTDRSVRLYKVTEVIGADHYTKGSNACHLRSYDLDQIYRKG